MKDMEMILIFFKRYNDIIEKNKDTLSEHYLKLSSICEYCLEQELPEMDPIYQW